MKITEIYDKLKNTIKLASADKKFVMSWAYMGDLSTNWGDKLNPYLAEKISGIIPVHRPTVYPLFPFSVHYWIGSHLARACSNPRGEIWGGGFISSNDKIVGKPHKIHAVRGKLSQIKLQQHGLVAPQIVGDPALLLPLFYKPKNDLTRTKVGIIPHIHEKYEPFFEAASRWDNVKIIDITGGIEEVVDDITSCDLILSSSLHGIICADAFGIPSRWIEASNKVRGDGFKFRDYFSSVGRGDEAPILVSAETRLDDLLSNFPRYKINMNVEDLLSACPAPQKMRK